MFAAWWITFGSYLKPILGRFLFAAGVIPLMADLVLPAVYYLLMLAGSVSLGKAVFILAGGGEGWAEDERATGLASVVGFAVVGISILTEVVALRGAAFPAVVAFAGIAAIATRAFLFKKPFYSSMPHLDALMEEVSAQERQAAVTAGLATQAKQEWWTNSSNQSTQTITPVAPAEIEREPAASQKIGEVIRMQGSKTESSGSTALKKPKSGSDSSFEEITWKE